MNELLKLVEDTNNKDMVLSEAYQLFESRMVELAEKYKNGEISKEEFQKLLEWEWLNKVFTPVRTDVYNPRPKEQQHQMDMIRRKRLEELRLKQKNGTITPQELKELGNLESMYRRRQGDIKQSP